MSYPHPHSVVGTTNTACRVKFGSASTMIRNVRGVPNLAVAIPVLGGPDEEEIFQATDIDAQNTGDGCVVFKSRDRLSGFVIAPPELDVETAARDLYRRLFAITAGIKLYRIWNYVPHINAVPDGLENYRRFCRGRSYAFEDYFGHAFQCQLPAACAVGSRHGPLAIAFLAGTDLPRHFENPHQVPAFEYPLAYGPRPPSFSRATLVSNPVKRELFVSGTAAIRGHATVSADDLVGQLT
jgi:chorismate lyase/3-hydroxybenzoate synthase